MDFDKIVLTFSEILTLRKSKLFPVDKSHCARLLRFGLVCELKEQSLSEVCQPEQACVRFPKAVSIIFYIEKI